MQQHTSSPHRLRRALVAICGVTALLALTTTAAVADSAVHTLVETANAYDTMGSGGNEWSGATYNANRNVLLTVDDETNAYEFDLKADGSIDDDEAVRVLDINFSDDFEGIAWISGDQYAMLSETDGVAYIVNIPPGSTSIGSGDVVWSFDVGGWQGSNGLEGIGIGPDGSFYVVDEKPASIAKYTPAGSLVNTVLLAELANDDSTGVVVAEDDTVIVVSHEAAKAIHYEMDWNGGTATWIGEISLSSFTQLEGVAIIGNEQLHFFGEMTDGGKTHSQMVGEIVTAAFDDLDVDCSGTVNIIDALMITRFEVGSSVPDPACGGGDSNGDGNTNVIDALLIAQCEVLIPNVVCPDV